MSDRPTLAAPRKHTRFKTCKRHQWLDAERPRRRAEFFCEGGPANEAGCRDGICRLWPGTDLFEPSVCHGEMSLAWVVASPGDITQQQQSATRAASGRRRLQVNRFAASLYSEPYLRTCVCCGNTPLTYGPLLINHKRGCPRAGWTTVDACRNDDTGELETYLDSPHHNPERALALGWELDGDGSPIAPPFT